MRFVHYLLLIPAIAGSALLLSCGDSSDSAAPWYTEITAPTTQTGELNILSDEAIDNCAIYRVTFPKAVAYSIVLSGLTANGMISFDTSAKMYTSVFDLDMNGTAVDTDTYPDATAETYVFTPEVGKSYFLAVDNMSTTAKNTYTLTISEALEGSVIH